MFRKLFPFSYPKGGVLPAALAYFGIYILGSLLKGTIVYLTEYDMVGGIVAVLTTVYVFIGLILLCFDHLKLHKK
ncbi:MAG: hypothetical protein J6B93_00800 [Clostridia bacterium]|nr:hypothetical protein [Clostridia bacterium]